MVQGLWLVGAGMAVVFANLGALLLVMWLLGKIFRPKEGEE